MKRYQILVVVLLVLALLPFCYVCLYALPYADDFCSGWEVLQAKGILTSIAEQYLYWNGRYASNVLYILNPISTGSLAAYSCSALVSIIIIPFVFYHLVARFFKQHLAAVMASLVLTLLYINYIPNLSEGIYWYTGAITYHIGAMLSILQVSLFIKLYEAKNRAIALTVLSLVLLFATTGFNEVGAMLMPLLYLTVFVFNYKEGAIRQNLILLHLAIGITGAALVVFSPGNATRVSKFSGNYQFFYSAFYAMLQTVRFTAIWLLNYPLIACSILTVVYADKVKENIIARIDWRVALAGALATIFTAAFIPYFGTGMLGQHRSINYVYPFFLLLWFVAVINFSNRYKTLLPVLISQKAQSVLLLSAILIMGVTGHSLKIWRDVYDSTFAKYKSAYMQRQTAILQDNKKIQPLSVIPRTFVLVDAKTDSAYWVNNCMKIYYMKAGEPLH